MTLSVTQVQKKRDDQGPPLPVPSRRIVVTGHGQPEPIDLRGAGEIQRPYSGGPPGFRVLERRATPLISHLCATSFQSSRVVARLPTRPGHETGMGSLVWSVNDGRCPLFLPQWMPSLGPCPHFPLSVGEGGPRVHPRT